MDNAGSLPSMLLQGLFAVGLLAIGAGAGYLIGYWRCRQLLASSDGGKTAVPSPAAVQSHASSDNEAHQHSASAAPEQGQAKEQPRTTVPAAPREVGQPAQRMEPATPAHVARTDALTLLLNRPAFQVEFRNIIKNVGSGAASGALLTIEIDHLQQVTDRCGKPVSDKALQQVARLLRKILLGLDVEMGRVEGDKFVAVVANESLVAAGKLAQEFRAAVQQAGLTEGEESIALTVSVGLAELQSGLETDALEARAELALQAAKTAGGNRVYFYDGRRCLPLLADSPSDALAPKTTEPRAAVSPAPVASLPTSPGPKGHDQRAHRRQKFGGMHCIAPYLDGKVPTPDMFYAVRFADISSGGFSMLLPALPECRSFVVALSKGNGTIYVTAEVVRSRESREGNDPLFTVGCRFTGRVEIDCMSREAQTV